MSIQPATRRALAGDALGAPWTLRLLEGPDDRPLDTVEIPAEVPGVVHVDLLREGMLADPYLDRNEDLQHWIGRSSWSYTCRIPGVPAERNRRTDLVFEGLDTLATVTLDGAVILETFNQHRVYRVEVGDLLLGLDHELVVTFGAPMPYAEAQRDRIGDLPNPYSIPFNFIRKSACNFGWDWGPQLTTSGIWKPVALESWSAVRLGAVRPTVGLQGTNTGIIDLEVDLEWAGEEPVTIAAKVAGQRVCTTVESGSSTAALHVEAPGIELWWPVGRGDQPLYELEVTIEVGEKVLDRVTKTIGFRTVEIDTTPVEDGSRWAILVNGERVWVRGVNWIPDDCLFPRVDEARYERRIDQALEANVNLLRVWGGGIYESDEFYEICDRKGVLVWQDFLFACAAYDEASLAAEVEAEATDAVNRLMSHASLVLWNGNNENHWAWWSWGWAQDIGERTWGLSFYEELLPSVVAKLDPARPYLVGSPSSGDLTRHPNDQDHGPVHLWKIWNEVDYMHYRDYLPRFVSEFGFQGPPNYATLERSITSRPLAADNPDLLHHQKADGGHDKLANGLAPHFEQPRTFDDWHFLTQLNQARAIAVGIKHFRRLHDRCAGTILWQLNDCWPVVSWAVIDGDERLKLAWYALRESYEDHLVLLEPDSDGIGIFVVNDSQLSWSAEVRVRQVSTDGELLEDHKVLFEVAPDSAAKQLLPDHVSRAVDPRTSLLVADVDGLRSIYTWNNDRDMNLPAARFEATVQTSATRTAVMVTATTLVRDLCLLADRVDADAVVDSQMVTLLPGEEHTFVVRHSDPLDLDEITRPQVLRAAN